MSKRGSSRFLAAMIPARCCLIRHFCRRRSKLRAKASSVISRQSKFDLGHGRLVDRHESIGRRSRPDPITYRNRFSARNNSLSNVCVWLLN